MIEPFTDLQDGGHAYKPGKFYPREGVELDEVRAEDLVNGHNKKNKKYLVEILVREEPKQGKGEYPKANGGGYYTLSNGEKVQGKAKAIEAEKALQE